MTAGLSPIEAESRSLRLFGLAVCLEVFFVPGSVVIALHLLIVDIVEFFFQRITLNVAASTKTVWSWVMGTATPAFTFICPPGSYVVSADGLAHVSILHELEVRLRVGGLPLPFKVLGFLTTSDIYFARKPLVSPSWEPRALGPRG